MNRQEEIDKRFNYCWHCKGKIQISDDKIIQFNRGGTNHPYNSEFFYSSYFVKDKSIQLQQAISFHEQCFLDLAGEDYKFWSD